jgi:hypothetical protein
MNDELLSKLTPEMQQRLAAIVAGQGTPEAPATPAAQPPAPPAPPKPPSLMDHLIALRQEVAALRQEQAMLNQTVSANSDVVEAVGQAVGQIYQMFQLSTQPTAQGPTFSEGFQQQEVPQSNFDHADF